MSERGKDAERRGTDAAAIAGWAGRVLGPIAAALVYLLLPEGEALSQSARACAAVATLMAIFWMTEALPLAVTSLLPLALFEPLSVVSMEDAASPYASPLIFLFTGGFMIALAMERWELHRRIALMTLRLAGSRLTRMVGAFMVAAAVLSMWVSNTATAVMMLPIGISVIALLDEQSGEDPVKDRFAPCLLLGLAYACSIGGVATLIGTPPNVVLAGFVAEKYGYDLAFGRWMLFGVPLAAVFLAIAWFLLTRFLYNLRDEELPGGRGMIRDELRKLGPMSLGEKLTLAVFLCTAALWIGREPLTGVAPFLAGFSDAQIAIAAGVLLFAIPVRPREGVFVMNWKTASRIPWDVLLLFGGGLSLAAAISDTGLDDFIGSSVEVLSGAPGWAISLGVAALIVFLTELTSNTATATAFLPILAGAASGLGVEPMTLLLPAVFAASCAFMLPVATPPNAIVFGSGRIAIADMVGAGFVMNLVSITVVTIAAYALVGTLLSW